MKSAIFQCDTRNQQIDENLVRYNRILSSLETDTDLVVMPEMFLTGFTANIRQAKYAPLGLEFMKQVAKTKNTAICGSLLVEENGKYYNRHYFVEDENTVFHYDKRHLFSLSNEAKVLTAGTEKRIINYRGWNICLITCYDLRFGYSFHNAAGNDGPNYDLIVCVASWADVRVNVWDILLRARAIENQCYVLGCNRCGIDDTNLTYSGHSVALNYKGDVIARANDTKEEITYVLLERKPLLDFRNAFPVWKDWD
ncbi:MAG: nitrilase family protein [Bacteroidales bacterium]|jgi:predicted amidohydrolase|nr:nitrilase family protein [Bacteroidales bacterium]